MNLGTARIIRANSRNLPLADNSVDLVVTSPPYFALRSYTDGGEHYAGQIGDEPTPAEFVDSLIEVTRECVRVLKPSGSLWVNLGDKYAGQGSAPVGARRVPCPADEEPTVQCPACGSRLPIGTTLSPCPYCWPDGRPGSDSDQNPSASSRSAQLGQYPSQPSPNSEYDSPQSRHVTMPESVGPLFDMRQGARDGNRRSHPAPVEGVRGKSLIGIPWRYALRCIDDLGLILRAEVIWSKPNGLPESVTDRVRRSHEQWFHFTLNPRYFSAVDEIREQAEQNRPQASRAASLAARHGIGEAHRQALLSRGLGDQGRSAATQSGTGKNTAEVLALAAEADAALGSYTREFTMTSQSLGKLPGSVWSVPTEPLRVPDHLGVDHFAAFPTAWPKRIIQGWSPAGVCVECGEGRRPVVAKEGTGYRQGGNNPDPSRPLVKGFDTLTLADPRRNVAGHREVVRDVRATITGYACACPEPTAPTRPSVILDPFGGTGTTAMVAKALGRHGISVDMSADYCRLAEWRCNDRDQLAKVLGLAKVDPVAADEQSLLDLLDGGAA